MKIVIPAAALAGMRAYLKAAFGGRYVLTDAEWDNCARAAFEAMVEAWPGMRKDWTSAFADEVALILPLTQTQEDGDD